MPRRNIIMEGFGNGDPQHDVITPYNTSNDLEFGIEIPLPDDDISPDLQIVPFRPLTYFIKNHVNYIAPRASSSQFDCPICRENCADSHERLVQIDLPTCHHIFGADCFDKHIESTNTCPMCREQWFAKRKQAEPSFHITVTVRDEAMAEALEEQLSGENASQLLRQILQETIELAGGSGDDTDVQDLISQETADAGGAEVSDISPPVDPEVEDADEGYSSGASTDDASNTPGVVRRDIAQSIEISDEDVAAGFIHWNGGNSRSSGD